MNAYSIVHNFDQPVYTPDIQLVTTALGYKQQGLDANRMKLQNMYDQFAALQVRNGFYQDYIEDRLKQVFDLNRNYHTMDLSDDNFTSVVSANVSQILDDNVKGAIMDTRRMDAEDKEWEDMRIKADGKYSTLNHEYALAMSDRNRYLNTKEFGNRYRGGAGFIEYTDYSKKWNDFAKDLKDRLGWTYFVNEDGIGGFRYQDKMRVVKPEDVRSEMMRVFNSKDIQQMQIDGWGQYKNYTPEQFASEWNSYIGSKSSLVENEINRLEASIATGRLTASQAEQARQQIQELKGNVESFNAQRFENIYDPQRGNLPMLQGVLYQEKYMDGIVSTYAKVEHLERKQDDVYAEYIKHRHNLDKFAWEKQKFSIENDRNRASIKAGAAKEGLYWDEELKQWVSGIDGSNIDDESLLGKQTLENKEVTGITLVGEHYDKVRKAMTGIREMFNYQNADGTMAGWLSPAQMQEITEGIYNGGIPLKGKYKTKSGRTIDFDRLTEEQIRQLDKQVTQAYASDPKIQEYENTIGQTIGKSVTHFSKMFSPGGDLQGKEKSMLPDFKFRVEYKKETQKFITIKIPEGAGRENYARLLQKKRAADTGKGPKLTPAENKTLEAYMGFSLSYEPDLTKEQRKAYYHYTQNNVLGGATIREKLPPLYLGQRSDSGADVPVEIRSGTTTRGGGDISFSSRKNIGTTRLFTGEAWWNREYRGAQGQELRASSISKTIKEQLTFAERNLKAAWELEGRDERAVANYVDAARNPTLFKAFELSYGTVVDPKKEKFAFIRNGDEIYYGITTNERKGTEKNLTGGYKLDNYSQIFVKNIKKLDNKQVAELENKGLIAPVRQNYAPGFDAYGKKEIRFGNLGIPDPIARKAMYSEYEGDLIAKYPKEFQGVARQVVNQYLQGNFIFSAKFADGIGYVVVMEDPKNPGHEQIYANRRAPKRLSYDDITDYKIAMQNGAADQLVEQYINYLISLTQ